MFQHAAFANDVAHALRSYHLILAYIFERKRQACVLALHDAHFAKRALADDTKEAEVVEVDLIGEDDGLAIGIAHLGEGGKGSGDAVMTGKSKADLCFSTKRFRSA